MLLNPKEEAQLLSNNKETFFEADFELHFKRVF